MKFVLPGGFDRVVLMIRHSVAVKTGNDLNKTLSPEGVALCHEVKQFYMDLAMQIMNKMGVSPAFCCSPFPRSFVTAWEMFGAANINIEECLKVRASLLTIYEGKWAAARKAEKMNEPQMIRAFLADPSLMTGDFVAYNASYTKFVEGLSYGTGESRSAKFVVAVGHEAGISMAANGFLLADQLGLDNCEAILFYVAGGTIVSAEKIVPEKTSKRDTWPL